MTHSHPQDWVHPQLQLIFFHNPTAYSSKQFSTHQPNLHKCKFSPLPHILLNITSSSALPITSLQFPIEATDSPSGTKPTGINYSRTMMSPILTPIKNPTDNPIIVRPPQLYTSVYFLRSITPHIPCIPLFFPTPIITQARAPIHSPHKLLESNIYVR